VYERREKFTRRSRERRDYLILFVGGPEFYVDLFSIVLTQYFFENSVVKAQKKCRNVEKLDLTAIGEDPQFVVFFENDRFSASLSGLAIYY
jgi:hypothetical protein